MASTSSQAVGGLVSGLDWYSIIDKLIAVDSKPITTLQGRIATANQKKTLFQGLSAKLLSLKTNITPLADEKFFNGRQSASSDTSIVSAIATSSAVIGTYNFKVGQLASTYQATSNGYLDSNTTKVGAGQVNIEIGKNATINRKTALSFLNGQTGIYHGSIKITDRSGVSATVDLSMAVTTKDVLDKINTASGIQVSARVSDDGDRIVLEDETGSAAYNLKVEEVDGGKTAETLGIKQSVAANTITGSDINNISATTLLSELNDGLGVRMSNASDIDITPLAGPVFSVNFDRTAHKTVGDIITAINDAATAAGAGVTAAISADGNGIALTGAASVKGVNDSSAALDLGLVGPTSRMIAGMNTSLLRNLNGGGYLAPDGTTVLGGVQLGQVDLTDRLGNFTTVNFAGAETLADAMRIINNNGVAKLSAEINSEGNGLLIKDYSGGSNPFVIANNGSTTATGLGIATAGTSSDSLNGSDLDIMHINENTLVSSLNGGKGVTLGKIKITTRDNNFTEVNLSGNTTLKDVIDDINGMVPNLTASINATGDGLLLVDTTGGVGSLKVEDMDNGTAAQGLNIAGTASVATPDRIDGSFEYKIDVSADDTLNSLVSKISASNAPVSASVMFDGSYYRLSLASDIAGSNGDIVLDTNIAGLQFSPTATSKDTIVLYGDTQIGSSPVLITSSSNTIFNVAEGLTLTANSVSDKSVTVQVLQDTGRISSAVSSFVEAFNSVVLDIKDSAGYDKENETAGLLMGDSTVENIRRDLVNMINIYVDGLPNGKNSFYDLGITLSETGTLNFDSSKLNSMLETDIEAVKKIFTYSANMALEANGGYIDASSTAAGFDVRNVANGDTDSETYGTTNGWQDDTSGAYPDYLTLNFGGAKKINRAVLWHINSSTMPVGDFGLSSFDVEYYSASASKWVTFQSFESNYAPKTQINFDSGIYASALRLKINDARNNFARLVEFQAFEDRGIGALINNKLDYLTKSNDGVISSRTAELDSEVEGYQAQIETITERLNSERARLINQFTAMEKAIATMQQQSDYMMSQLSGFNPSGK